MSDEPIEASKYIQRAWNAPITTAANKELLAKCSLSVNQSRLEGCYNSIRRRLASRITSNGRGPLFARRGHLLGSGFHLETNICQQLTYVCTSEYHRDSKSETHLNAFSTKNQLFLSRRSASETDVKAMQANGADMFRDASARCSTTPPPPYHRNVCCSVISILVD